MAEYVFKDAALYAKASAVTNEAANLISEFSGDVTIGFTDEFAEWFGQAITRQGAQQVRMDAPITIAGLAFQPAWLETCWGATLNESDNLKTAAAEAANSYTFKSTTEPVQLEYLISGTLTGGKICQIWVKDGFMRGAPLTIGAREYTVGDVEILPIDVDQLVVVLVEQ